MNSKLIDLIEELDVMQKTRVSEAREEASQIVEDAKAEAREILRVALSGENVDSSAQDTYNLEDIDDLPEKHSIEQEQIVSDERKEAAILAILEAIER